MTWWRRFRPRWDAVIVIGYFDDKQRTVVIGDIRSRSRKYAAITALTSIAKMSDISDDWLTLTVRVAGHRAMP